MKLCTYDTGNGPHAGVVVNQQVLDAATLLGEAGGLRDVRALLELPNDPLTRLKSALGGGDLCSGCAAGECSPAGADPAATDGTRFYGV